MATDRLLLAVNGNQAVDAKATGLAANYPASNVLDEEDLSAICRSVTTTLQVDLLCGTAVLGATTGVPSTGAPTAAVTRERITPDGRFVFAIENGVLRIYTYDTVAETYGARLSGRTGSTLTADVDVALWQLNATTLLVLVAGSRSSGPAFEIYTFALDTGTWGPRKSDGGGYTAANGKSCAWLFTADNSVVFAVGHDGAPVWVDLGHVKADGTLIGKYGDPATSPGGQVDCITFLDFGGANKRIGLGIAASPFVRVYPVTFVSQFNPGTVGTVWSNPGTLPTGQVRGIAASTLQGSNIFLFCAGDGATPLTVYRCTSSAFAAKLSDPAVAPGAVGYDVAIRPGGAFIAVAVDAAESPIVYAVNLSGSGSIGARYAPFGIPAAASGRTVAWTPAGDAVLFGHTTDPWIGAHPFSAAAVAGTVDFVLVHATNASLGATLRLQLSTVADFSVPLHDETRPFYPTGVTTRMLEHYPRHAWIVLPSQMAPVYARVTVTDTNNPDGFVECGLVALYEAWQPAINFSYGWRPLVEPLTGIGELDSGHIVTDPRSSRRGLRFDLKFLTETELMEAMHPLQMQGPQVPVAALPKPNESTGMLNFMLGVWGPVRIEDDLSQPSHGRFATSLSVLEQF